VGKSVKEMTVAELRCEIEQARHAEAIAEYQDVTAGWLAQRNAARERQRLAVEEYVRRRGLFVAQGGMAHE
jgi:hypothetical protein